MDPIRGPCSGESEMSMTSTGKRIVPRSAWNSRRTIKLLAIASICLMFFLAFVSQSLGVTATKYIRISGGDCASIGVWDQATMTCTLTGDLTFGASNGIVIDANGVTLDGAGHTITGGGGFSNGVYIMARSAATVKNLTIQQFQNGIGVAAAPGASIFGNTLRSNAFGVSLLNSSNARVFNNNFDANATQVKASGGTGNVFNLAAPVGGNWFSGYDAPVEGCNDYNTDYFCDAAYSMTGAQDQLPWTVRDGWSTPPTADIDPPAIVSVQPSGSIGTGATDIVITYTDRSNINLASAGVTLDGNPVSGCTATETTITCPSVSGYATGPHNIGGSIADILGNTATIDSGFSYIDDIPPVVTDVAPTGIVSTASTTISASYSDSGTGIDTGTTAVTLDGNPVAGCAISSSGVSCAISGLADGAHVAIVSVSDPSGNTGTASASFTVDTTPPSIDGIRPSGTITTGSTMVQVSYSDATSGINSSTAAVYLDGARMTGCLVSGTGIDCQAKNLTLGLHVISGSVADNAGHTTAINGEFTFSDTTAPLITDLRPPIYVNKARTTIGATFSDTGTGVDPASAAVYLDGAAVTNCTVTAMNASCTVYDYSLGAHTYSVRIADKAGNTATGSGSFTYDPTAPTVSKTIFLKNNSTGGGCSQVGYWFPSTKTCVLKEDLMFIGTNGIVFQGNDITVDGSGHFIVGTGGFTSGMQAFGVRNVAVKNLTVKKFRYGAYLISVSASQFQNNTFTENTYGMYLSSTSSSTIFNNNFLANQYAVNVKGGTGNQFSKPAPDGGNYWSAYDTPAEGCNDGDADGFCDAAYSVYGAVDNMPWTTNSWTPPPAFDAMPPTITGIEPAGMLDHAAANIYAYYSDAASGIDMASVSVYLDGSSVNGCAITGSGASCSVYGLADGNHVIMVSVADNMGNAATAAGTFSVDVLPPQISLPSGYINSSSASVRAYIYDAVSGVDSATFDMYVEGATVSGCSIAGTDASCDVYGLDEGAHVIRVSASDMLGHSASMESYLSIDSGLPIINNLKPTGTISKSSATISAYMDDAVSGINASSVAVYLDGSAVSGCTLANKTASCNVYGLTEAVHNFTVQASDRAGNSTTASGTFTVSTSITTKYIRNNVTGGDCTLIGDWDNAARTCTLTSGYTFATGNGIVIDGDGITLDGGGHTLTGGGGFTQGINSSVRPNIIIRNIGVRNFRYGIYLNSNSNATVTGNTFTANAYGVYLQNSSAAKVYGNDFDTNTTQANVTGGSGNAFSQPLPVGGNWWSNFDTPAEGCNDADANGFCDAAFTFTGGQDTLPRVAPN